MNLSFKIFLGRLWLLLLALLMCNLGERSLVQALFEDQAFKFDWRQQYIGKPEKLIAWYDTSSAHSDLIITVTQSNVLAGVFVDSGILK